jgi:hypothetical protein
VDRPQIRVSRGQRQWRGEVDTGSQVVNNYKMKCQETEQQTGGTNDQRHETFELAG